MAFFFYFVMWFIVSGIGGRVAVGVNHFSLSLRNNVYLCKLKYDCFFKLSLYPKTINNMKKLNIAFVAHDARKKELVEWVTMNREKILMHNIFATGTTGRLITEISVAITPTDAQGNPLQEEYVDPVTGHTMMRNKEELVYPFVGKVTRLKSGPLGGDAGFSWMISEGQLDVLFFWCDNLIVQGHNADIQGLSRLASLYNIAYATNRTTADMIISSPLFGSEDYERLIPKCIKDYEDRPV